MLKKVPESALSKAKILRCGYLKFSTKTTADHREIEFFNKLSRNWWDEQGPIQPLHAFNLLRVPFVRDCLISTGAVKKEYLNTSQPLQNLRILDVGCGGGLLSEALAKLRCDVVGLDASPDLITIAKEHASQEKSLTNLTYEIGTIEEFALHNMEAFDAVVSSEVLEHVRNVPAFITECVKCVKPGGSIIFTTINQTFLSKVFVLYVCEYITSTIPKGTHEYEKFVKPALIEKVLRDNNCSTKLVRGQFFNVFTRKWSWINNNASWYSLHGVKIPTKLY